MPDEYGMDLAPNTASSIAVQMSEVAQLKPSQTKPPQISRQPSPYTSHCMDSWEGAELIVPQDTEYSLSVS